MAVVATAASADEERRHRSERFCAEFVMSVLAVVVFPHTRGGADGKRRFFLLWCVLCVDHYYVVCRFDVINFDGHPDGYSVLIYILIYEVHLSRAPLTIDVVPGEGVVVVVKIDGSCQPTLIQAAFKC